jgi:hypothetical protein
MTVNCHSFVKKMNTENNSCKLFGLWGHDEHYELECDQFTGRSDMLPIRKFALKWPEVRVSRENNKIVQRESSD